MLKFITTNSAKFKEFRHLLAPIKIEQLEISLDEIQDIDPKIIIKRKLSEAFKHHSGPFIVEDSSMNMEALGGKLPGPFIKYFNEYLGNEGMSNLANSTGKIKAKSVVMIAYAKSPKSVKFFVGTINGKIVKPRGSYGMGFDPIFQPVGSSKTFGESKSVNDFTYSARGIAVKKLKKYLLKKELA